MSQKGWETTVTLAQTADVHPQEYYNSHILASHRQLPAGHVRMEPTSRPFQHHSLTDCGSYEARVFASDRQAPHCHHPDDGTGRAPLVQVDGTSERPDLAALRHPGGFGEDQVAQVFTNSFRAGTSSTFGLHFCHAPAALWYASPS